MIKPLFLILISSLTLTACSTVLNHLPGVYHLPIQQGNIVTQEMVDQLQPNMNKRQVLYIMGSPMMIDAFHPNRWDYIYAKQVKGEEPTQKRLSLFFSEDDRMIGIQGDFRPSEKPKLKPATDVTINVPKRDIDRTMWEKITGLFSSDK